MAREADEREGGRSSTEVVARLEIGGETARGHIINVSAWGAYFKGASHVEIGSEGVLARDGAPGVRVRVVWTEAGGCGLMFLAPAPRD